MTPQRSLSKPCRLFSHPLIKRCILLAGIATSTIGLNTAAAEDYYWNYWVLGPNAHFPSAYEACAIYLDENNTLTIEMGNEMLAWCRYKRLSDGAIETGMGVDRRGDGCPIGKTHDPQFGRCLAGPVNGNFCSASPGVSATGEQVSITQPVTVSASLNIPNASMHYNSLSGAWTSNYSDRLNITNGDILVIKSDGQELSFSRSQNTTTAIKGVIGSLQKTLEGWKFEAPNEPVLFFDEQGTLIKSQGVTPGSNLTIQRTGLEQVVTNDFGKSITLTENTAHQVISITSPESITNYVYDSNGRLATETHQQGTQTSTISYLYEDKANSKLLTGIIDERGVRSRSWSYDGKGRVLTSSLSGDINRVTYDYSREGIVKVTNALGKSSVYNFQTFQGTRRITSIEGEASTNCLANNSKYAYTDNGQFQSKTDSEGFVTTFSYNDRGLETSRTEASGTPLARTTVTEWDPARYLKTKVVEPTRTTVYTYDAQGRSLSQQTTPN